MDPSIQSSGPGPAGDCRCECGQLLARWTGEGVEIKCKRCRRVVKIPFPRADGK